MKTIKLGSKSFKAKYREGRPKNKMLTVRVNQDVYENLVNQGVDIAETIRSVLEELANAKDSKTRPTK